VNEKSTADESLDHWASLLVVMDLGVVKPHVVAMGDTRLLPWQVDVLEELMEQDRAVMRQRLAEQKWRQLGGDEAAVVPLALLFGTGPGRPNLSGVVLALGELGHEADEDVLRAQFLSFALDDAPSRYWPDYLYDLRVLHEDIRRRVARARAAG